MSRGSGEKPMRGHPELPLLGFSLTGLLGEVRRDFGELDAQRIEVWLERQPTLACIAAETGGACVRLHAVLNHPQTPRAVVAFILRHELLHLVIRPREVNGKWTAHPPEFWEAERRLCPHRGLAWAWLELALGGCLRRDQRRERTVVKASWKHRMNGNRPTLEQAAAMPQGVHPPPEDGEAWWI